MKKSLWNTRAVICSGLFVDWYMFKGQKSEAEEILLWINTCSRAKYVKQWNLSGIFSDVFTVDYLVLNLNFVVPSFYGKYMLMNN